jgi:hypothetical protein
MNTDYKEKLGVSISVFQAGRRLATSMLEVEDFQELVDFMVGGIPFHITRIAGNIVVSTEWSSVCLNSVNKDSGITEDAMAYLGKTYIVRLF